MVAEADRLIASTDEEADAARSTSTAPTPLVVRTIAPGVDLDTFVPGRLRDGARSGSACDAGRARRCCSSAASSRSRRRTSLLRAAAALRADVPELQVVVVGGPSGSGLATPDWLDRAGAASSTWRRRPVRAADRPRDGRVDYYRAADVTVVPSYNESFGLVALESQACGTPVVAAAVGGLTTAVADGVSGLLVDGHDPEQWGKVLATCCARPPNCRRWPPAARGHAERFSWQRTTDGLLAAYSEAMRSQAVTARRRARSDGHRAGAAARWNSTFERVGDDRFVVALPGEKRLKTACWLSVGAHALEVQAFVMRKPDENREQVYEFLLQRNVRMYGVSWADRQHGRRLPGRPAAARRGDARTSSTACSGRSSSTPTARSTPCSNSASARPSAASGRGGSRTTSRWRICAAVRADRLIESAQRRRQNEAACRR